MYNLKLISRVAVSKCIHISFTDLTNSCTCWFSTS